MCERLEAGLLNVDPVTHHVLPNVLTDMLGDMLHYSVGYPPQPHKFAVGLQCTQGAGLGNGVVSRVGAAVFSLQGLAHNF